MVLETIQHGPAIHSRHVDVERDGIGLERVRELEARLAIERGETLETLLARHVEQDLVEVRVVFHDQEHAVPLLDAVAIVVEAVGLRQRIARHDDVRVVQFGRRYRRRGAASRPLPPTRLRRTERTRRGRR